MPQRFRKICLDSYPFRGRGERSQGLVFPGNVWSGGAYQIPPAPVLFTDNWNYTDGTALNTQSNWTPSGAGILVHTLQYVRVAGGVISSDYSAIPTTNTFCVPNKQHSIEADISVQKNCTVQMTLDIGEASTVNCSYSNNGTFGSIRLFGGLGGAAEVDANNLPSNNLGMEALHMKLLIGAANPNRLATAIFTFGAFQYRYSLNAGHSAVSTLRGFSFRITNPVGNNAGVDVAQVGPITVRGFAS